MNLHLSHVIRVSCIGDLGGNSAVWRDYKNSWDYQD